jgi:hypothetical protein
MASKCYPMPHAQRGLCKVKLSLCMSWRLMRRADIWLHSSLILSLCEFEWSTSSPSCFTPVGRAPGTHQTGDWVGCRSSLVVLENRKNLSAQPGTEPPFFGHPGECCVAMWMKPTYSSPVRELDALPVAVVRQTYHENRRCKCVLQLNSILNLPNWPSF